MKKTQAQIDAEAKLLNLKPPFELPSNTPYLDAAVASERGIKDVEGKLRFDLIPPEAMVEIAKVFTEGATRYGDRNWEKGIPVGECVAAIERHLTRFKLGQDFNPKTECHEAAHMAFWCMVLISQSFGKKEWTTAEQDFRLPRAMNTIDTEKLSDFLNA